MGRLIQFMFIIMLAAIAVNGNCQDSLPVPIKTWSGIVEDFEVDNLGNLFVIDQNQQLKKFGAAYDSVGLYNNVRRYGNLYAMDVSNPLKVLLWYKEFSIIVILDRLLGIRSTIDLNKAGIVQCNAVAQSYDNNIWIYDDLAARVIKMDESGNQLLESADFRVVFDDPPHPYILEDHNKQLYAYDSSRGLVILDYFGAYQKLLSYKHWRNVQAIGKNIVATDEKGLVVLQPDGINTTTYPLSPTLLQVKKIRLQGSRLFVLSAEGALRIYPYPAKQ